MFALWELRNSCGGVFWGDNVWGGVLGVVCFGGYFCYLRLPGVVGSGCGWFGVCLVGY